MAQAINSVASCNKKLRAPVTLPDLSIDQIAHIAERAPRLSTLHAMACTQKSWQTATAPTFRRIRQVALAGKENLGPGLSTLSIPQHAALQVCIAYLLGRLKYHLREEEPVSVVTFSRNFVHLGYLLPEQESLDCVRRHYPALRGLSASDWNGLLASMVTISAQDKLLLRIALAFHPDADKIFFHAEDSEEERSKCVTQIKAVQGWGGFYTPAADALLSMAYESTSVSWGDSEPKESLFRCLVRADNFNWAWTRCASAFDVSDILSYLKQPGLPVNVRTDLLETLLGPEYPRLPDSYRKLPDECRSALVEAINTWLRDLPAEAWTAPLKHLADRYDEIGLVRASRTQLAILGQQAWKRKKAGDQNAALLLKTLVVHDAVSKKDIQGRKKRASS
jgi:hypothetical protein